MGRCRSPKKRLPLSMPIVEAFLTLLPGVHDNGSLSSTETQTTWPRCKASVKLGFRERSLLWSGYMQ